MSAMWDIWRFIIPPRKLIHLYYYLYSQCRVGRKNKEVSLLKLHGHGELIFSHIWNWIYLLMFFQQEIIYEAWMEDTPKKSQRHIKSPWYFWICYCWIFFQEWKLPLVPLTATEPDIFLFAMNKFLSDSYDSLEEALTHMNSLKIKSYPG